MHSLLRAVVGGAVVVGAVARVPAPSQVTPAPSVEDVLVKRQDPDAISLAQILLTAVPESLRQIAVTNLPAVSSILWGEFLDDKRPDWFLELPLDIQDYLIRKFGLQGAWPTEAPTSSGLGISESFSVSVSATDISTEPSQTIQPSGTNEGASQTGSGATVTTTTPTSTEISTSTASSDRTSVPTSFATSYTTTSSESSTSQSSTSQSSSSQPQASTSQLQTISTSSDIPTLSETHSSTPVPEAPASSTDGLSKTQKIGLGVGIPFGLLAAIALGFGCCALCRRHKKKDVEGSLPPATPDFIPRFAFQERYDENLEHRTPLNRDMNQSTQDVGTAWDDEGVDPAETAPAHNPYVWNDRGAYGAVGTSMQAPTAAASAYTALDNEVNTNNYSNVPVMAMKDPKPIMAPALYHTHTSNRARGKRTSYTSLHSVAEVSEPDELESPILGRHNLSSSPPRNLIPTPAIPAGAQIKRKPVSSPPLPPVPNSPSFVATSPAAEAASHKLLRQTMPEHSGSSSSGLALTTSSGLSSGSSLAVHAEATSPISPVSNRAPSNPFQYDSYVEDYGPEYQNGYVDVDDGLYGGNTSLSQYPEPRRKSSKTEWPLRNLVGSQHRRKSSPLWERIYEE